MLSKKLKNGKKIKPKDRPHYVNSKEFEEEIRRYYETNLYTEKLCESLTKIAQGLSYAPNFINYSYKEEMIGDAMVKMFQALKNKKFGLEATDSEGNAYNPFSYFTTIAFHAFINRIKKEKKHQEIVTEYKQKIYEDIMGDTDITNGYIYVGTAEEEPENYNSQS